MSKTPCAAWLATLAALGLVVQAVPAVAAPSAVVAATPSGSPRELIAQGFADPDVVRIGQTWYAYATNDFRHLPVASAPTIDGPWRVLGDAMPGGPGSWASGPTSATRHGFGSPTSTTTGSPS